MYFYTCLPPYICIIGRLLVPILNLQRTNLKENHTPNQRSNEAMSDLVRYYPPNRLIQPKTTSRFLTRISSRIGSNYKMCVGQNPCPTSHGLGRWELAFTPRPFSLPGGRQPEFLYPTLCIGGRDNRVLVGGDFCTRVECT